MRPRRPGTTSNPRVNLKNKYNNNAQTVIGGCLVGCVAKLDAQEMKVSFSFNDLKKELDVEQPVTFGNREYSTVTLHNYYSDVDDRVNLLFKVKMIRWALGEFLHGMLDGESGVDSQFHSVNINTDNYDGQVGYIINNDKELGMLIIKSCSYEIKIKVKKGSEDEKRLLKFVVDIIDMLKELTEVVEAEYTRCKKPQWIKKANDEWLAKTPDTENIEKT